ncbi:MAG TPA: hypothetical protein VGQ57_16810 [Polyangiaceae bacterium]|nr:hypothetical protein [Polyangiaceae bacterium]
MEALSDEVVRTLAERYAETVAALGIPAGDPLLVLPNGEFFPDRFTSDAPSIERLVARLQGYAGLEALDIGVNLLGDAPVTEGSSCGTGGCGSGACATPSVGSAHARVERTPERWLLHVPAAELGDTIVLTARLATSLGAIALVERGAPAAARLADGSEPELAAVALGFGVLLLEASYVYRKSCGGPSVACGTALGCSELAVLFALSVAREGHSLRSALGELGTTQRAVVKAAAGIVADSVSLVRLLKETPERVARGDFRLREGGSFFGKLFARRSRPKSENERLEAALAALERGASVDELASLVGPADGE